MAEREIRTLVVDDSEFFAQMTAETLAEEHGIDAVAEHSGQDALDRLETEAFDCIVSDYAMPGMDGLELLSTVREGSPSLPFILLTGRGDEETASDAIAAGVADYLLKLEVVEDKQYGRLANRIQSVVDQNRTRKKFESLVANSTDGIAQVTTGGVVLSVNPAMADQLGGEADALVDNRLTDVIETEAARRRVAAVRKAIDRGETIEMEDTFDGRHYQNQFVPVESYRERDTVQLVSRDITERVEGKRELKRQNNRLEEFASVVSHDLRNPLNVANSALALLDRPDDEEDGELFDKVDRSLDRMGDIIEDVLALAREGRTVDEPELVPIETLAREAWAMVETGDSELSVIADAEIEADPTRARDLFANLFRNAVEHNDSPVTVQVGTDGNGQFFVGDDGTGVPVDGDVFEMGHTSTNDGTGIGLAIVSQIAEAHGWSIDLTESETGGARFEVTGVEMAE